MKKSFSVILFLMFAIGLHAVDLESLPSSNSGILDLLDSELQRRDTYIKLRLNKIDSLNNLLNSDSTSSLAVGRYLQLGQLIAPLYCDSAIAVYSRGLHVAMVQSDTVSAQRFLILRASELHKFGASPDALNILDLIYKSGVKPENRLLYDDVARDFNLYIAEIIENSAVAKSYLDEGYRYMSDQLDILPADSHEAQIIQGLMFYAQGKRPLAAATIQPLVSELEFSDPDFSLAMTILGGQYYYMEMYDEAVRYLALAALSDIYRGDRKSTALIRLGRALYAQGELDRAHNYLSIALDESIKANDKSNCVLVSEALMPVAKEIKNLAARRYALAAGLIVALVAVILLLGNLYLSNKRRVREIEQGKLLLAQANLSKETYISEFINLCSSYMASIEDFNRMCRRKLMAGQSDDLLKFVKDGTLMAEQRKKFDDIFDESFLAVYPGFIEELNRLLLPDKQITVSGNVLTTELRVLALSRLGVDDTTQIARFLGVSNNTIYTYRNKFRNMAIERETFDADILKIGAIV